MESASTGVATAAKSARRQWTNTNLTLLFLQIAVGVMTAPERRVHEPVNGNALPWSMIPKKPAPDLIRGGNRFSEKIMLQQKVRL